MIAERAMLYALAVAVFVPIGSTSKVEDGMLTVRGAVLSPDGRRRVVATHIGLAGDAAGRGQELAAMLLAEGAAELAQIWRDRLLVSRRPVIPLAIHPSRRAILLRASSWG
ncbi:MAG: hypothetical protein U0792_13700 [Gemmataceae bacterium]